MKGLVACIALFCSAVACQAQAPSPVATFAVEQPQKPYHSGDRITLKMTVTNVSQSDIVFDSDADGGQFTMEWYDLQEKTSKLLAPPAQQKTKPSGNQKKKKLFDTMHPGETRKDTVVLLAGRELAPHTGLYKLIVSRIESTSNVSIRSNAVTIEIVPK
jgi:hypothetical protein